MGKRSVRATVAGALLAAWVAGCGGGGGDGGEAGGAPPAANPAPATPTIGVNGGTVGDPGGAAVIVPPGALASETTIRVAIDGTGAPAFPAGLTSAGNTFVITPHGGEFTLPIEVRIPASGAGLGPNQELKLAKAQPGGTWEVLSDSVWTNGMLSTRVRSFSYFAPVVITYQLPIAQLLPWAAQVALTCGSQPCDRPLVGAETFTFSWVANNGQLPAVCTGTPELVVAGRPSDSFPEQTFALGSGAVTLRMTPAYARQIGLYVFCSGWLLNAWRIDVSWKTVNYPAIEVLRMPTQLDVVDGRRATLEAVLAGGAQVHRAGPTPTDRAIVDWQRSDDNGASWRPIARSYQDEANRAPLGSGFDWLYWSVSHGFVASAADQGALVRVRACYTPPNVPAPPCTSGPATRLNVLQQSTLPVMVDTPRSMLVRTGQTASFSATAGGAPAPTLRWQSRPANSNGAWVDASNGTGATTGSYTTPVLGTADNGTQYRVVATNALGSAESAAVTVSVSDLDVAPTVTTQPSALSVAAGSDAAFAISARGTEALSYQWRKDGMPIAGANSPVLRLPAVVAMQAGAYSVTVSNAAGTVSSDAAALTVSVGAPAATSPAIVTQPVSVHVNVGNTATFAVGASGSGPQTFQWRRNGVDIAGATAAFHSLAAASTADQGSYDVRVSNAAGSVTSSGATLTVATTAEAVAPTITTQPSAQVQLPGGSALFAVAASGSGPLTYQWSKGGTAIPGATAAVLLLASVSSADIGSYSVAISNAQGTASSDAAVLTVVGVPVLTAPPASVSVTEGASATFSVAASGSGLRYQWTRNGLPIAGATSASHITPAVTLGDSGAVYAVVVYSGAGAVFSSGAVLAVTAAAPAARAWGPPVAIETDDAGNAESVQVAANAAGEVMAVWQQSDGASINVYANRYTSASGWGTPQRINPGVVSETAQQPHVAIDANGNAIAVWMQSNFAQNSTADNIWASRYTAQAGWSAAVLIETGPGAAGEPRVAMDGAGNAIAAFTQQVGGRLGINASRFEPTTGWAPAAAVETAAGFEGVMPQIAIEASGRATVVWQAIVVVGNATSYHVRANRYTPGTGWGSAVPVAVTTNNASPRVAVDAAGNAVAVWVAPDGTWDSIWSSRQAAGGGWTTPVLIETDNINAARIPHVAVDGNGNAVAVWTQSDGVRDNVMANRYVPGTGWGSAVLIETDNAGSAYEPQVVIDTGGNATTVWSQRNVAGFTFNAWANRYSPATGWGTATMIDNSPEPARGTQIAIDGLGNVTAAWAQNSGSRTDLWATVLR